MVAFASRGYHALDVEAMEYGFRTMSYMSGSRGLSGSLSVVCVALIIGAANGQTEPPSARRAKLQASAVPKATRASTAPATAASPAAGVASGNLRQAIAQALEPTLAYRTFLDGGAPKLIEPRFAGPLQRKTFFFGSPKTIYCVSAKLDIFPFPVQRVALVTFESDPNGKSIIKSTVGLNNVPYGCMIGRYEPFPELAALRHKRRQALGKPD
jgi:hypothetical protein